MSKKNIIKMIFLNLIVIALNIGLFSSGIATMDAGADILRTALGWTLVIMSGVAFSYGNWSLLSADEETEENKTENINNIKLYNESDLVSVDDYLEALNKEKYKTIFEEDISLAQDQLKRMTEKENSLKSVLSHRFDPSDENYEKFSSVIASVKEIFLSNSLKLINRILIFDYKDYKKISDKVKYDPVSGSGLYNDTAAAQLKNYNQQVDEVRKLISENEGILVKLNDLLLEITKLGEEIAASDENPTALDEMDVLISQTKYYNM